MTWSNINQSVFAQSIGRFEFKNTSGEKVPPYAAMIVASITRQDRGQLRATIRKCTEDDEKRQNHSMILFNLDRAVPNDKVGYGTFSLPCVARVDGEDGLEPQDCLGPQRGKWGLVLGGKTHTVLFSEGSDPAACLIGPSTSPKALGEMIEPTDELSKGQKGVIKLSSNEDLELEVEHEGTKAIKYESGKILQAGFENGRWLIDVEYC